MDSMILRTDFMELDEKQEFGHLVQIFGKDNSKKENCLVLAGGYVFSLKAFSVPILDSGLMVGAMVMGRLFMRIQVVYKACFKMVTINQIKVKLTNLILIMILLPKELNLKST